MTLPRTFGARCAAATVMRNRALASALTLLGVVPLGSSAVSLAELLPFAYDGACNYPAASTPDEGSVMVDRIEGGEFGPRPQDDGGRREELKRVALPWAPGGDIVRRVMTPVHRFYIRTGNGVSLAFCNPEHALLWVTAMRDPTLELTTLDVTTRAITWCEACAWCGALIGATITGACQLHDGDCPDFTWEVTLCTVRAVQALTRRAGHPLPPRAFIYLADAAENQVLSGEWPNPADLARRVWDVRVDWLPAFP